jgi:hypothetical protein
MIDPNDQFFSACCYTSKLALQVRIIYFKNATASTIRANLE